MQGRLFRVSRGEDTVHLRSERALGRLAQGMRRIRAERSLNQAEIARLAEVSPSAISQAEAGQRGLSLETLLNLTNELPIGLDALLENKERPGIRARSTQPRPPNWATAGSCSVIHRRAYVSISSTFRRESEEYHP